MDDLFPLHRHRHPPEPDLEPPELLSDEDEFEPLLDEPPNALTQLLQDKTLLAIIAATVILNFALLGFLLIRYDSLQDPLPLHFDATGLPDRIEAKTGILALPAIGLIVLGLNAGLGLFVYRHERAVTMLLAGGAFFVQVLMWLASVNIAGGLF